MASATLGAVDYVVLVLLLLSSAVIGVIFGFIKTKKATPKEFLLANGTMSVIPTSLSLIVSFLSAITLLGTPSEMYTSGTMYLYRALSWSFGATISAQLFMPKFRELNLTSIYEYLERRFDRTVRLCASFSFMLYQLIYMAIVLYAPALALSQTTNLNIWLSVVSIGVVCTFYSSVGGIRAVIWTDVLQAVVMLAGLFPAIIQGLISAGGFERVFSIANAGGRIEFDNIDPDPRVRHTVWGLVIGSSFNALSDYGFSQTLVQRYLCVRTERAARQAIFINVIGIVIFILLAGLIGIIIYAYYADCDPYTAKLVNNPDQLFPYFVMEILSDKPGLPGVFLACIFSGSLSTVSSGLNSLAAVFIEDIFKGLMKRQVSEERQGLVSKICSIILGVVVILLTFVVSYLGSVINAAISLAGVLAGPTMGVFLLGFLFPQANRHGALVGLFVSLAFQFWIFLGAQLTRSQRPSSQLPLSVANCSAYNTTVPTTVATTTAGYAQKLDPLLGLYSVSYMWYMMIAVLTVWLVGLVVSYLTGPLKVEDTDPQLLIKIGDLRCVSWLSRLKCWCQCCGKNKVDGQTTKVDGAISSNNPPANLEIFTTKTI